MNTAKCAKLRGGFSLLALVTVSAAVAAGPVIADTPTRVQTPSLLMIRLSAAKHTADDENWSETFRILKENRKACDEVWFPTHVGYPKMEWHRDHVRRLSRYAAQLRALGIIPSVGFQATLGHSDAASSAAGVDGMTWSGFVGRGGTACRFCSCPRQPEFLSYMREMARLYASFKPGSVWLNDDLRIKNHKPASPGDRAKDGWIGCWCADCIKAFNVETGGRWTRESLDAAMSGDSALFDRWEKFSFDGIAAVARAIAEEVHRVSPETRLAYQHGAWRNNAQLAVFRALHEATGLAVGSRPGGGAYYDFDPRAQIIKAFGAAHQRKLLGNPEWIGIWCPEIETYPRAFASRTAQGILNEALINLALGMNSLSLLIMDPRYEPYEWFGKTLLAPLADERPLLDAYRRHNAGAMPAGLADATTAVEPKNYVDMCDFVLAGVPVLSGVGKSYGEVRDEDVKDFKLGFMSSTALLALRHKLDERTGGRLPVVIETPSVGLVIPNVLSCGTLRSVMLENARIDVQQPLTLRLRGVPKSIDRATWWALRGKAVELPIEKSGDDALVTIPQLSAWNCGCLFVGNP